MPADGVCLLRCLISDAAFHGTVMPVMGGARFLEGLLDGLHHIFDVSLR
jgi:hypothetical protein